MQPLPGQRSNSLSSQSRRIATVAIILFALSGLISGFAVGAFVRPKIGGIGNNNGTGISPIVQQTKTATPVATPRPQTIRFQSVDGFDSPEVANGSTTYTLTAHLKPVLGADNQPVNATNLTCKLWLISRVPDDQGVYVPSDIAKNVNNINTPFTIEGANKETLNPIPGIPYQEIPQSLTFNSDTQQTHSCNTQGEVTWRYQVSPSVTPGKYTLVGLYDWSGKHWTWFWVDITIRQASPN